MSEINLQMLAIFVGFSLIAVSCSSIQTSTSSEDDYSVYIVYMGGKTTDADTLVRLHHKMVKSVDRRNETAIVHSYKHGFNGFSAKMTHSQARTIAKMSGVVSVFPSRLLQLHTTRSWSFLDSQLTSSLERLPVGEDVIVGVLDTGIWPESESFSDEGMGPVPSRWKGTCSNPATANASEIVACNRKIVGARYYSSAGFTANSQINGYKGPRDDEGHGTHTSSTAAGSLVGEASMLGIAKGSARGGLPTARIAMYKVCGDFGCFEADIMKAFDDAIADGVDVLSLSLGGSPQAYDTDGIAIGSFHAVQKGIAVSCSAGNSGPDPATLSNGAPWIVTVGASTIDRAITSPVVLGNMKRFLGTAINFQKLDKEEYKLVYGGDIANNNASLGAASHCQNRSLDPKEVNGSIVLCILDPMYAGKKTIISYLSSAGGKGAILVDNFASDLASYVPFPATVVKKAIGDQILSYIKSTSQPVATILPTETVLGVSGAPAVAGFSSRGPNSISLDVLKPDVTAPGVNILAAWAGKSPAFYQDNDPKKPVLVNYNIISGTSMSCPHVAGALAFVKAAHPHWTPAALRSALMTTANVVDNQGQIMSDYDGSKAGAFDYGSGEVRPKMAVDPGLIYDITPSDYITYLCASGYTTEKMRKITGDNTITCHKSNVTTYLNYPSIAIPNLKGTTTVVRSLTNVGIAAATYTVNIQSVPGIHIIVQPAHLQFRTSGQTLSFSVTVTSSSAVEAWQFSSLTWSDGEHYVRSPIAVKKS